MNSSDKPLCIDLYTGLHGWGEGFLAEGYRVIGVDIVDMCEELGQPRPDGMELLLADILTLDGAQFKDAAVIVASPPCTEPSYRAMPWKRAKALNALGPPHKFINLFNACFRIREEASKAAGHRIPLIVENVVGAQRWIGRAGWHFGSYYLWGDIPALMPIPQSRRQKMNPDGTGHPPGSWFAIADSKNRGAKSEGQDWNRFAKTGEVSPHWRMEGLKTQDHLNIRIGHTHTRHLTNPAEHIKGPGGDWFKDGRQGQDACIEGIKQSGISGTRNNGKGDRWFQDGAATHGSKSKARKAASAQIAKIPFPLAQHIAKCFK